MLRYAPQALSHAATGHPSDSGQASDCCRDATSAQPLPNQNMSGSGSFPSSPQAAKSGRQFGLERRSADFEIADAATDLLGMPGMVIRGGPGPPSIFDCSSTIYLSAPNECSICRLCIDLTVNQTVGSTWAVFMSTTFCNG